MLQQDGRAFQFVQQLAAELGQEKLELPAFPDVVGRLQAALTDTNASVKDVVGIISSEPVLSARLLGMPATMLAPGAATSALAGVRAGIAPRRHPAATRPMAPPRHGAPTH